MKTSLAILFIVAVLTLVFVGPFFTILAINTLFNTVIPYTLGTWLAAFWLTALVAAKVKSK